MKRLLLFVSLIFSVSCKDSIDPKTAPKEESVFYCILNADTTFQTAYLNRTYDVAGTNPLENQTDPAISKAVISINYRDQNYLFTDSSVSRTDTSRYKNNFQFYYSNELNLQSKNLYDTAYPVSVTVTLPNNKILTSSIESIPVGDLYFEKKLTSFPSVTDKFFVWMWEFLSNRNSTSKYYYLPKLEINYSKVENGVEVRKKKCIPCATDIVGNQEILAYAKVSKENMISYNRVYVENAFKEISAGDADKGNYIIHNLTMTVVILNQSLAAYYASNTTFNAEFSVRIDAADVSNINGGYGLFGLYSSKKTEVKIDREYLTSLGYKYEHKL